MIDVKDLCFSYDGEIQAIQDVSFSLSKGESLALLGDNGSGKSTLIKLLAGMLKPDSGTITYDKSLIKRGGMVFQNPDNQFVSSLVEEDLLYGLRDNILSKKEKEKKVSEVLNLVGLEGFEKKSTHEISGGQKQLVAIAGVLIMSPDVLFLDEVTSMLDHKSGERIIDLLRKLKEEGITIIYVTHEIKEAALFDKILIGDKGRFTFFEGSDLTREFESVSKSVFLGKNADIKIVSKETLISCEKISLSYKSHMRNNHNNYVLKDISLSIAKGEFIGIKGDTGSGKTSLIRILSGLIKPSKGKVYYKGEDINNSRFDEKAYRKAIGIMFQFPDTQIFEETVEKDVGFGLDYLGFNLEEKKNNIKNAIKIAGLPYEKYASKNPYLLSDGEKRRVVLAGVLSKRPEIIILDEPIAGLDLAYRKELFSTLKEMQNKGKTIIIISHNEEMLYHYADRIIELKDGHIL